LWRLELNRGLNLLEGLIQCGRQMQDLNYLALIWCSVFISYWLANRTKLTPLLFYLVMGSIMVSIGLLPEQSTPFIAGFSEFGIILIMFAIGFEENTTVFLRSIKRAWGIALFGALGPFLASYFCALYLWQQQNIAILVALAMAATTVSLSMAVLKHENLHRTKAATGIMTSAVLDNVASLVLIAVLVPLVSGQSEPTLAEILLITFKALLFFVVVMIFAIWIFPGNESQSSGRFMSFMRRFGLHDILSFSRGKVATLAILTIAIIFGIMAHHFGLHPAVGAYMAGLIMRKEYFYHIKHGEKISTYKKTRKIMDDVAFAWIGPVFFVNLGAKIVLDSEILISIVNTTLLLTLAIMLAQIVFASLAARFTANFNYTESLIIGFGMLGRAELAFVVMDIGYVHNSIFTTEVFYTLMFTAFLLNISVPLLIKFWHPYFSGKKKVFWENKIVKD